MPASAVVGDSFTTFYGHYRYKYACYPKYVTMRFPAPLILMPQTYGPFAQPYRADVARILAGARPLFLPDNNGREPAFAYTVAAMGLNLIYGHLGLLSFAQLSFWGIGGYSTALSVMTFGGTFWDGLLVAAMLNAALAVAIGYPTLRLNRHAFVVVVI